MFSVLHWHNIIYLFLYVQKVTMSSDLQVVCVVLAILDTQAHKPSWLIWCVHQWHRGSSFNGEDNGFHEMVPLRCCSIHEGLWLLTKSKLDFCRMHIRIDICLSMTTLPLMQTLYKITVHSMNALSSSM